MYTCIGSLAIDQYCSVDNKILLTRWNETHFKYYPTGGKSFCCYTDHCNGSGGAIIQKILFNSNIILFISFILVYTLFYY